jgi:hypothetical protein
METGGAYKARFEAIIEQAQAQAKMLCIEAALKEKSADEAIAAATQIQALQQSVAEAKARLAELARSGDDQWEKIKTGLDSAWNKLTDVFSSSDNNKSTKPDACTTGCDATGCDALGRADDTVRVSRRHIERCSIKAGSDANCVHGDAGRYVKQDCQKIWRNPKRFCKMEQDRRPGSAIYWTNARAARTQHMTVFKRLA